MVSAIVSALFSWRSGRASDASPLGLAEIDDAKRGGPFSAVSAPSGVDLSPEGNSSQVPQTTSETSATAALSKRAEGTDRKHQNPADRSVNLDRRPSGTDSDVGQLRTEIQHMSESLKELRERVRTQGTIIWTLEQMLREQVGKMEAQLAASMSQMTTELESVRRTLEGRAESIDSRREPGGANGPAQNSLDERLNCQAKAIESMLSVVKAQSEAWAQIAAATAPFDGLVKEVTEGKDASADSSQ